MLESSFQQRVLCSCPALYWASSCTTGLITSGCDACLGRALPLVQEPWSVSNGAQHWLCSGGAALLQRVVLVNSVLCWEAVLLGRIMEEEEEAPNGKRLKRGWSPPIWLQPYIVLHFSSFSFLKLPAKWFSTHFFVQFKDRSQIFLFPLCFWKLFKERGIYWQSTIETGGNGYCFAKKLKKCVEALQWNTGDFSFIQPLWFAPGPAFHHYPTFPILVFLNGTEKQAKY